MFCEALFRAVGIGCSEFYFGTTKVFFRAGKVKTSDFCTGGRERGRRRKGRGGGMDMVKGGG